MKIRKTPINKKALSKRAPLSSVFKPMGTIRATPKRKTRRGTRKIK